MHRRLARHLILLPVATLLTACLGAVEDNSLESYSVTPDPAATDYAASGTVAASAGAEVGDWTLAVGDEVWSFHSPSHVDLSVLSGELVDVSTTEEVAMPPWFRIDDADGLRFVASSSAGEDGSTWFGHSVWALGEKIGRGVVVNAYDEEQDVVFVDVQVTADDGVHTLLPGEPASVTLDGDVWRVVVAAAYEAQNAGNAKCGTPDMLQIELMRTDADPGERLLRPIGALAPMGMCG